MTEFKELRLDVDWQPAGDGIRAPELRETFGRLTVWVGKDCVTLAEDATIGSVRRSIFVSLYPLAEWIVFNWWRLQFDSRPSVSSSRGALRSHSTWFAGDGFCWPDLRIVPEGDVCRLQWQRQTADPGRPLAYLAAGLAWGSRPQVLATLEGLVEAVIERLRESNVQDSVLEKEWAALRALDPEEVEFCRAVSRLGVDPLGEGVDLADDVDAAFAALGGEIALELLDSVSTAHLLVEDTNWLGAAIAEARDRPAEAAQAPLDEVRAALASTNHDARTPPWTVGWEAARAVRARLQIPPDAPLPERVSARTSVHELGDRGLVAAGVGSSVVMTRAMGDRSQRFVSSRALWHAAVTPSSDAYLLTGSASTGQAIGRAFAAELLAPAEGIRVLIDDAFSTEEVARIADHYGASDQLVKHQIENQVRLTDQP